MQFKHSISKICCAAMVAATLGLGVNASATPMYDSSVSSWDLGSGNTPQHFTVDTASNGIQVGLRIHDRFTSEFAPTGTNSNIYDVTVGTSDTPTRSWDNNAAVWNCDFSVDFANNSPGAYNVYLMMDYDPAAGSENYSKLILLDPSHTFVTDFNGSHSPNPDPSLLQDSSNLGFDDKLANDPSKSSGWDEFQAGEYKFDLLVYSRDQAGRDGDLMVQTSAIARVTDPSQPTVPEPATLSLLGLGLAGAGVMKRRRARKA